MENGFFECHNGQCLNISNVCDGKKHCSDNSDEIDCTRLGYEIRLSGSQEKHKGRIEIKSKPLKFTNPIPKVLSSIIVSFSFRPMGSHMR